MDDLQETFLFRDLPAVRTSSDTSNVSSERPVSHDQNTVSHDQNNVSHDRINVSPDPNNVSHDPNNVSHDPKNVSHDKSKMSHDQGSISSARTSMSGSPLLVPSTTGDQQSVPVGGKASVSGSTSSILEGSADNLRPRSANSNGNSDITGSCSSLSFFFCFFFFFFFFLSPPALCLYVWVSCEENICLTFQLSVWISCRKIIHISADISESDIVWTLKLHN